VGVAIGSLVLIASVGCVGSGSTAAKLSNFEQTCIPLYALSIPALLGLYFGLQGLKNKERWSLIWGTVLSCLLLAGAVLSSLYLAQSHAWFRLAVTTSISGFLAIVLGDSLVTLKGNAWNIRAT
jgi:cytochrome c oxidase subunit IV